MRLFKRILIAIGIVVSVAGVAMVATTVFRLTVGSQALARELADLANRYLVDPATTRIRIGDVGGNALTGLELHRIQIEVRSGKESSDWLPFLVVERLRVDYRFYELVRRRVRVRELEVVEPRIAIRSGSPLPRLRSRGQKDDHESSRPGLILDIGRLRVERGKVLRDTTEVSLDLAAALRVGAGTLAVALDSLGVKAGNHPELVVTGQAHARGDSIALEEVNLRFGGTRVEVAGTLDGTQGGRLKLVFDPLDLADALAVSGTGALLGRSGWVRGQAVVEGRWSDLELGIDLEAMVGEDRIENLAGRGRVTANRVEVENLALTLNGIPFKASGQVGLGENRGATFGTLEFTDIDLNDFPWLRAQPWMPEGALSGVLTVGAEEHGRDGRQRPFDLKVTRGVVRGIVVAPAHFSGAIFGEGRVRLDEYQVTTRGGVIKGQGTIDPRGELALDQEIQVSDLRALAGMFGERRFGGEGRLDLKLTGPVRSPVFEAQGFFDSVAFGPARLAGVAVELSRGAFRPEFTMVFDATAAGGALGGRAIDTLAVAGDCQGRALAVERLVVARGKDEIRAVGGVDFSPGQIVIEVTALEATMRKEHWEIPSPARITRMGKVWKVDGLNLTGSLGALALSGTLDRGGPTTALDLHVVDVDLRSLGAFLGTQAYSGNVEVTLMARGGGADSRLEFHAKGDSVRVKSFAAKHVELIGSVHGETITISRLIVERGGTIEVAGDIRFPQPLQNLAALRNLGNRAAWEQAVVDLGVKAMAIDLEAWHGIHPQLDRWVGVVDLTATFTGNPGMPDGTLALRAETLKMGVEELGPIETQMRMHGGFILIERQKFTIAGSSMIVNGSIPVGLSLLAPPVINKDLPLELKIDLVGGGLGLARFITDKVVDAGGTVHGAIELSGTLRELRYQGAIEVAEAWLQIRAREETLEKISGRIELAGDHIKLINIVGSDGDEGTLRADGTLRFLEGGLTYDITLELTRFDVGSSGEYSAELSGVVTLRRSAGGGLPVYTGQIVLHRLDYLREVGRSGGGDPGPSSWVGRFDVEIPGKVWIRNADLDVELEGDITYERTVSGATVLGQLETRRGRARLFGHTFKVTNGDLWFTDPDKVDPEVNVTAETQLPEARVFANITGRASDRKVILSSEPPYDQGALWKMLVPGVGDVTGLVAMTPFMREVEGTIFQEVPGLSVSLEERVDEDSTDPTFGVRAGTYLGSELFFSAYQGFSQSSDQDVSLEYELSPLFLLKGSAVRRGVTEAGSNEAIEQEYNIDLNMRWEF
jgi:autotransporter translocation and assembly factor TamB